jgi:hypothetical protein
MSTRLSIASPPRRCLSIASLVALALALALALAVVACGNTDTKLKVTGIDPDKGDVEGGQYVHIYGNRFVADGARNAKVYFGSRQGTVVRFANDGDLIVQAPGGKPGEVVDVLVIFDPGGELRISKAFTFVEKNTAGPSVDDLNTGKK